MLLYKGPFTPSVGVSLHQCCDDVCGTGSLATMESLENGVATDSIVVNENCRKRHRSIHANSDPWCKRALTQPLSVNEQFKAPIT